MNRWSYSRSGRPSADAAQLRTRGAMRGMVMLELQLAILVLGVGIGANLSIQTQALQRMIDSAQTLQAALQNEYGQAAEVGLPPPPDVL